MICPSTVHCSTAASAAPSYAAEHSVYDARGRDPLVADAKEEDLGRLVAQTVFSEERVGVRLGLGMSGGGW